MRRILGRISSLAFRHVGFSTYGSRFVIGISQNALPRCVKPTMASASYPTPPINRSTSNLRTTSPEALGKSFFTVPRKLDLCYLNTNLDPYALKEMTAEERIMTREADSPNAHKYPGTNAQTVQNKWFGNGSFLHSLHSRLWASQKHSPTFPTIYPGLTSTYAQPVHNISAGTTGVKTYFSSQFTGSITTTTTFIYKRIEEEAAQ